LTHIALILNFPDSIVKFPKLILTGMKALNWIGWISLALAALIVLLAAISLFTGSNLFGFTHIVNYFHAANTFALFAIAVFIVTYRCDCKK
jgi:hypothetical protein